MQGRWRPARAAPGFCGSPPGRVCTQSDSTRENRLRLHDLTASRPQPPRWQASSQAIPPGADNGALVLQLSAGSRNAGHLARHAGRNGPLRKGQRLTRRGSISFHSSGNAEGGASAPLLLCCPPLRHAGPKPISPKPSPSGFPPPRGAARPSRESSMTSDDADRAAASGHAFRKAGQAIPAVCAARRRQKRRRDGV